MACVEHPGVWVSGRPLTTTGSATINRRIRPAGGCSRLSFEINTVRRFGRVSRVAKGADCKSAVLRLRRFESYLSHHFVFIDILEITPPCWRPFHVAYVANPYQGI